jgi:hypothetical protein
MRLARELNKNLAQPHQRPTQCCNTMGSEMILGAHMYIYKYIYILTYKISLPLSLTLTLSIYIYIYI